MTISVLIVVVLLKADTGSLPYLLQNFCYSVTWKANKLRSLFFLHFKETNPANSRKLISHSVDGEPFPPDTHAHRCIILLRQASRDTCLPKTSTNSDYQAPICWRFFTLSKHINSCVLSICQPSVVRQCTWLGGVYATVLWFWGVKPPPPPRQRHPWCPPEGPRAAVMEDGRWGIGSVLTTASS